MNGRAHLRRELQIDAMAKTRGAEETHHVNTRIGDLSINIFDHLPQVRVEE
jgi:hypothetical protein